MEKNVQQTLTEQERNACVERLTAVKNKGAKTVWLGLLLILIGVMLTIVSISSGSGYLWYGAILWGMVLLVVGIIQQNKASKQLRELECMAVKRPNQTESKTYPVAEQVMPAKYDFRHVKDEANIIKYDTLSEPLNHLFYSYLNQNLPECRVVSKVAAGSIFPNAPEYAMPINFLVTKGEKKVAVLLVHNGRNTRYSVLETAQLCRENGVECLQFFIHLPNEENYVVERVRRALV